MRAAHDEMVEMMHVVIETGCCVQRCNTGMGPIHMKQWYVCKTEAGSEQENRMLNFILII